MSKCPNCGHCITKEKKAATHKSLKLMSEGGKSLKAATNHYGRDSWSGAAKSYNCNYEAYRNYFTQEPIMHRSGV